MTVFRVVPLPIALDGSLAPYYCEWGRNLVISVFVLMGGEEEQDYDLVADQLLAWLRHETPA